MPASRPLPPDRQRFLDAEADFEEHEVQPGWSPLAKGLIGFAVEFVGLGGLSAVALGAWYLFQPQRSVEPLAFSEPAKIADASPQGRAANTPRGKAPGPRVDRETLAHVKAATVFIQVATNEFGATGSGFVMKVDGDTVWIVTNDHVISPPPERRRPFGGGIPRPPLGLDPHFPRDLVPDFPQLPRIPGPQFPPGVGPRHGLPLDPFNPRRPGQQQPQRVQYTVVFHSGTPQEKSYQAAVVGAVQEPDLAVLQVRNVAEPPQPLDLGQGVEAVELMPVVVLGFPFGQKRSLDKGNPAVTVQRATVSSLRRNAHGGVTVEIEGNVNPGNSGGPLVDTEGRLIGIIFAKYDNTQIGLAVHAAELDQVLQPRIGAMAVSSQSSNGISTMRMEVEVSDPFNNLTDITFLYVPGNLPPVNPHPHTQWEPLPNAQKVTLRRQGLKAVGTLQGKLAELAQQPFAYQFAYRDRDGQMRYSEPRRFGGH